MERLQIDFSPEVAQGIERQGDLSSEVEGGGAADGSQSF